MRGAIRKQARETLLLLCFSFSVTYPYELFAKHSDGFGRKDKWWQCSQSSNWVGQIHTTGRLSQTISLDGVHRSPEYIFSRAEGLYIAWQSEAKTAAVPRVSSVQIATAFFPSIDDNGRHGYYGYIFGDEEFVASLTMSSVADARPHTGVSGANFYDPAIGKLTDHDRWTFVVQRDDGKEMLRRLLPVPDRAGRSKAFAVHRNAILRAWDRRSMEQIETVTTPSKEADAEGICLLSTPASRDEINISQI